MRKLPLFAGMVGLPPYLKLCWKLAGFLTSRICPSRRARACGTKWQAGWSISICLTLISLQVGVDRQRLLVGVDQPDKGVLDPLVVLVHDPGLIGGQLALVGLEAIGNRRVVGRELEDLLGGMLPRPDDLAFDRAPAAVLSGCEATGLLGASATEVRQLASTRTSRYLMIAPSTLKFQWRESEK